MPPRGFEIISYLSAVAEVSDTKIFLLVHTIHVLCLPDSPWLIVVINKHRIEWREKKVRASGRPTGTSRSFFLFPEFWMLYTNIYIYDARRECNAVTHAVNSQISIFISSYASFSTNVELWTSFGWSSAGSAFVLSLGIRVHYAEHPCWVLLQIGNAIGSR